MLFEQNFCIVERNICSKSINWRFVIRLHNMNVSSWVIRWREVEPLFSHSWKRTVRKNLLQSASLTCLTSLLPVMAYDKQRGFLNWGMEKIVKLSLACMARRSWVIMLIRSDSFELWCLHRMIPKHLGRVCWLDVWKHFQETLVTVIDSCELLSSLPSIETTVFPIPHQSFPSLLWRAYM